VGEQGEGAERGEAVTIGQLQGVERLEKAAGAADDIPHTARRVVLCGAGNYNPHIETSAASGSPMAHGRVSQQLW
jgi:hypothetical protein